MMLIIITLGVLNFFFGELVPAGDGFGWDGAIYADLTRNLNLIISNNQLSNYYAHRILPSAIVSSMLTLLGAAFSNANIIQGFQLYNILLLIAACWVWKRLANNYSISLGGRWIGFSSIFINFSVSKQAFYYPILTDVTALFLGLLLLLFYVEKRPIALFFATIIGAFVWPLVSLYGAILLLFINSNISSDFIEPKILNYENESRQIKRAWIILLVASILCLILLKVASGNSAVFTLNFLLNNIVTKAGLNETNKLTVAGLITGLPSITIVLIGLNMIIGSWQLMKPLAIDLLKPCRLYLVALATTAILIPWYVINAISNPLIMNPNSYKWIIHHLFFTDRKSMLLLPFVSLVVFWGPAVSLLLLYWKEFCIELRKLGPGIMAMIGLTLPLGLITEPRYVTLGWPFMVFALVMALEKTNRTESFKYIFAILTIIYAQFWMKINLAPWPTNDFEGIKQFPKQIYFMHYGFWMNWLAYLIQLPIVIYTTMRLKKTMIPK